MAIKIIDQGKKDANTLLRDFVKEVLKRARLTEADGSFNEPYVDNLTSELQKRIGLMVMDALSESAFDAYTKMLYEDKADAETVGAFLEKNIENFSAKRQKVFEDFATGILTTSQQMKDALH